MKKTIKIVSIVIAIILLLLVITPFIVALLIDPNDYKPEISKLVNEQTGRTLTINGDINYSIFPWLGLSLGELQLSNSEAAGFSKTPFAEIKSADVRIKIMPLFSSKIEVDKVSLSGLKLTLEKNQQGITNWQDLIAKSKENKLSQPTNTPPSTKQKAKPVPINKDKTTEILPAIAGIELIDAHINWHDKQLNQQYELNDFNFTTGVIANDTPTNININFSFKANQPELSGSTRLSAKLEFNIKNQVIKISNLEFIQDVKQQILKPENLKLKLTSDLITANMSTQTAAVSNLNIATLGLELKVSLEATKILADVKVSGTIASNEMNPKEILQTLQIQLPKMADNNVLKKAKLDITLDADLNNITIPKVSVQFDESKLSGKISLADFANPKLRYQLHLNEINLDRYLPPPSSGTTKNENKTTLAIKSTQSGHTSKKSSHITNAEEAPLPIPVELLRTLDIKGSFTIGKATVSKLKSSDIKLNILAKNGNIRLYPVSAKMYQGQYNGDLTLNVQKKIPVISMNEKINGVSFEPLVTDFLGEDYISGTGSANATLTTKGLKISEFTKNLNGNVSFNIKNSKIKYLNPVYLAKKAVYKLVKKDFKEKETFDNPDVFKIMKGSFQIKNGVAHNRDFITKSRDVNLDGKGYVDLVKRYIKYDARIIFQKDLKTGNDFIDRQLKPLTKKPVPFPISGPFNNIKYNKWAILNELTNIHKQKIKKDAQKKIDFEKKKLADKKKKLEQEAKQKVQKKLDFEKKKLERELKKRFGL